MLTGLVAALQGACYSYDDGINGVLDPDPIGVWDSDAKRVLLWPSPEPPPPMPPVAAVPARQATAATGQPPVSSGKKKKKKQSL